MSVQVGPQEHVSGTASRKGPIQAGTTRQTFWRLKEDGTEEPISGKLYKWAGNICHLEDKAVVVEDLSPLLIDPAIVSEQELLLSSLLKDDMMTAMAFTTSVTPFGTIMEQCEVAGPTGFGRSVKVYRCTIPWIDADNKDNSQYRKSKLAASVQKYAEKIVGPPPSPEQVQHVMARILARNNGVHQNGQKAKQWADTGQQAHDELFQNRTNAGYIDIIRSELAGMGPKLRGYDEQLKRVQKASTKSHKATENKYYSYCINTAAEDKCDLLEGFDIILIRDRNDKLICGVYTEAIQHLMATETVTRMGKAAEAFCWRFPYQKADKIHHPTSQGIHLKKFPEKNVWSQEKDKQPHHAGCGVEHCGLHHEQGHGSGLGGLHFERYSAAVHGTGKSLLESSA